MHLTYRDPRPHTGVVSAPSAEAGAPELSGFDKTVRHANGMKFIADGRKLVENLIEVRASYKLRTYDLGPIEFYGLDNGGSWLV